MKTRIWVGLIMIVAGIISAFKIKGLFMAGGLIIAAIFVDQFFAKFRDGVDGLPGVTLSQKIKSFLGLK